jgi:hypothetical protein
MPRVTLVARSVLRHLVQPGQLRLLMAGLARGRCGEASRTMGPVAIGTGRGHLTMRRGRLLRMARRTGLGGDPGMGLVAVAASLMPGRRAALLRLVTATALGAYPSGVRLVTRCALAVPLVYLLALSSVARRAAGDPLLRSMRQARVAPLTSLMARQRLHARQLCRVAGGAGGAIGALSHEIVRGVAALALGATMKLLIARGVLVASAAVAHARAHS